MMRLILDSSILFAGLLKNSITRRILIDCPFTIYTPETLLKEIRKYEFYILQKSGLTKNEFEHLLNLLTEKITIVEKEKYLHNIKEADELIGNADKGDVPFLALALTIPNDGIWTENIKHFGKQNKVKVWTTKDIIERLK